MALRPNFKEDGYVLFVEIVKQIEILNGHRLAIGAELQINQTVLVLVELNIRIGEEVDDFLSNGSEAFACFFLQKAHQHGCPFTYDLPFLGLVQLSDIVVSSFEWCAVLFTFGWQRTV